MKRRLLSWSVGMDVWAAAGFRHEMTFLEGSFQESHSFACRRSLERGQP